LKNTQIRDNYSRHLVWYKQSQHDYQAALLSIENGFNEWASFQAVQSVEKALKAIIVYAGLNPPRIHKLQTLIGISNRVCSEFKNTKFEFRYLESFTFISRYPFLLPGKNETPHELITKKEAQSALDQALDMLSKISVILQHPAMGEKHVLAYDEVFTPDEIAKRVKDVVSMLVEAFKPEKIILFGRFAREQKVSKLSTMDILIIANTDLSFIDRIHKARNATKSGQPIVETLVYTPGEFELMTKEVGEGFLEDALREGRVLYERE
jgi:HEPN domain-containing protein